MEWSSVFIVVAFLAASLLAPATPDTQSATATMQSTTPRTHSATASGIVASEDTTITMVPQTAVATGLSHYAGLDSSVIPVTSGHTSTVLKDCNQTEADIGFLLDINAGGGQYDFKTQVNFIKAFVSQLHISSEAIQVGVVTYNNDTHPLFLLNQHSSRSELVDALSNIFSSSVPYHRAQSQHGLSSTHTALDYMRTVFFTSTSGARVGVPKVLFLLTDGNSTDPPLAMQAAAQINGTGVHLITVSLGGSRDEVPLHALASNPASVISVNRVGVPLDSVENATEMFCHVTQTSHQPTNCSGIPADLVFILDTSVSEGPVSFHTQIEFVANVTSQLDIGPSHNQIGLITYSTYATNQFYLNNHTTKDAVLKALNKVAFHPGASYTGDALQFVRTNTFTPAHGHRDNAVPIVIVLADGQSSNRSQTEREAAALKARGALVLAVGIGSETGGNELNQIATDAAHVFTVSSHHFLSDIEDQIVAEINCGDGGQWVLEVTSPKTTALPACRDTEAADILFSLDTTGRGGQETFDHMITFTKDLINDFTIGVDRIHFSVLSYASQPSSVFWFNSYTSKADMITAIQDVKIAGGSSDLDEALQFAKEYAYAPFHGARPGKPNYIIIVTNGVSENANEAIQKADELKREGMVVMAVGVGDKVDTRELNAIATDPSQVFLVSGQSDLVNLHEKVHRIICEGINAPSVSATAPAVTVAGDMLIG